MAITPEVADPRPLAARKRGASPRSALNAPAPDTEPKRSPEEEARDILAVAAKNQPEDGPNTRRAAVRACKYLRAMVNQYETTIKSVHIAARTPAQKSKGTVEPAVDYRPQGEALPVISADSGSQSFADFTLLTSMQSEQLDCPHVGMSRTLRAHYGQFKPSSPNSKSK